MMSAPIIHSNETKFPKNQDFIPERWQQADSKHLESFLVPFSKGSRQCLGIKWDSPWRFFPGRSSSFNKAFSIVWHIQNCISVLLVFSEDSRSNLITSKPINTHAQLPTNTYWSSFDWLYRKEDLDWEDHFVPRFPGKHIQGVVTSRTS